jgi:Holliday junction resolvasome RuvABC endonuclease subunit
MQLASLQKQKADRVLGIDASTASVAFCLFKDGVPLKMGKLPIVGANIYDKIKDANGKAKIIAQICDPEYIAVESAIMVKSADAGIKIAMIVGAILSVILKPQTQVVTVAPISWQSYIGNKNFTKAQKLDVEKEFPGKSAAWYKNKIRERRKQFTMDFFNDKFKISISDNDVGDATGIAYYAYKTLTERTDG